jgi:hypothetical protein
MEAPAVYLMAGVFVKNCENSAQALAIAALLRYNEVRKQEESPEGGRL